jgi:hypothetical protein
MRARIYDPKLGRFLQPDPIGYGDGMNMYAYTGGDPVNGTDPSGLAEVCATETGFLTKRCVFVDGDNDGNARERNDLSIGQARRFSQSYHDFLTRNGNGQDISAYGKPVATNDGSPAERVATTRVASQFVGYAITHLGSHVRGLQEAWNSVTDIDVRSDFGNRSPGEYLGTNRGPGLQWRTGQIIIYGGYGFGNTRSIYKSPSDLARLLLHEPLHFYWDQGNVPADSYVEKHHDIDAWARRNTAIVGFGRCASIGGFPACD